MFAPIIGHLPFQRGKTASGGLLTPTATYRDELEGRFYWAEDTLHGTKQPVVLLCLRNTTGAAITVARKFVKLDITTAKSVASAGDTFPNTTAGGVALPLDDAYVVGSSIADDDIFTVVAWGYCSVLTGASVTNLAAGNAIASDNAGLIANVSGGAAAGEFVIGRLDYQASYSAATATRMFICPANLAPPPAAG